MDASIITPFEWFFLSLEEFTALSRGFKELPDKLSLTATSYILAAGNGGLSLMKKGG